MGKTSDLTDVKKAIIDTLKQEGKTQKEISQQIGCSQSAVSRHLNGKSVGRKQCGRKRCTTRRGDRTLRKIVEKDRFQTLGNLRKQWTESGVETSRATVHRRVQEMGYRCRIPQILVQKFARKTQSIFSSKMTESTTHVIMKTGRCNVKDRYRYRSKVAQCEDEHLVCERTLKYFLGIAGRKWVLSYEWIVQSFREGRILDEYDFEVKGDVINGRNHRGPRRSRLGSDGLLLTDYEICCLGSFKDMTSDDLEWMVSLCGASVVHDPSQFEHKSGTTSLVVVQQENESYYAAMKKKYRCLVIAREWVLDSVSSYKLQAFDSYLV
ncbi:unnamed protein product [Ranitomeya imitator]|uniref:BRCT domain-containing protein n=1 Tax=Ranitomeya imitator TaxID=111125 RepID=A0ABN9MMP5_9NEOB|nr:unnamed protein product [Ranitomeya imitator]